MNNLHLPPPLQLAHQLPLADTQLRTDLVEAVRPVQIPAQRPSLPLPLSRFSRVTIVIGIIGTILVRPSERRRGRCGRTSARTAPAAARSRTRRRSRDRVLVHPVHEPLDDAKRHKPAHIDARKHGPVLDAPRLHALALLQRRIQHDERLGADRLLAATTVTVVIVTLVSCRHVPGALVLHGGVGDEGGDLRRAGVDGGEAEDVEEQQTGVVEEVAEGGAGEVRLCVGAGGDGADAVDAVDVREEGEQGQIPVGVGEGGQVDGGEGDVVVVEGRGRREGGEEFDVERVGGIWPLSISERVFSRDRSTGGAKEGAVVRTDGDHAFAVVVQILQDHLA